MKNQTEDIQLNIRQLTINDFDAVNDIFMQMQALHVTHRPDLYRKIEKPTCTRAWDYESSLKNNSILMLGAEDAGKIVGFCMVEMRQPEGKALVPCISAHIRNLAVHENHRRKGIATALYKEAVRCAKAHGAVRIDLKVYSFNEAAIAFYQSLGMTVQSYTMEQAL